MNHNIQNPIPPDDLTHQLTLARPDEDQSLPHIGLVGDTYTILLDAQATNGKYCLLDFHVPPGGGPAPHRHDFEETFIVLEGEIEATFRGETSIVKAGETLHIPANSPHQFRNATNSNVRLLCICSPSGQEEFFKEVGIMVGTRTTAPPKPSEEEQQAFMAKATELAPKFKTELLKTTVPPQA